MAKEKAKKKGEKVITNILLGLGAFTAVSMAAKAGVNAAYNNISYEFVGAQFNFNQLAQGRIGVNVQFKIKNGNAIGATVTAIEGKVTYGSIKISDVMAPLPLVVPPRGEVTGMINLSVEAMTLLNDVINAFASGSNVYTTLVNPLKFKGIIRTNIINIPVEFNIPIVVG